MKGGGKAISISGFSKMTKNRKRKGNRPRIIYGLPILLPIACLHSEKLASSASGTKRASPPSEFQSPLKHLDTELSENPFFRRVSKEVESFHTLNLVLREMETRSPLPKSLNCCITGYSMLYSAIFKKWACFVAILKPVHALLKG